MECDRLAGVSGLTPPGAGLAPGFTIRQGARVIASAWEIATEMQLAGGGGEAPSSDEEGAATA
eukprot:scaffold41153_cov46-Phaeocystis_antarctica.AAC.3